MSTQMPAAAPLDVSEASAEACRQRCLRWLQRNAAHRPGRVDWLQRCGSTNSELLARGRPPQDGAALLTEIQSAGRGRLGRHWLSAPGGSLCLSLSVPWPKGAADAAGISLLAGAAVAEVLQALGLEQIKLKWPNDVYLSSAKLGGLLVEFGGVGPSGFLVIGVGINLDLPDAFWPGQEWIDLRRAGLTVDRAELAARLLERLLLLVRLQREQGLPALLPRWHRFDLLKGQAVRVRIGDAQEWVEAEACGIDERGRLRVLMGDVERCYSSAEVSLRPA
jgi:BirA family biotin operon repressor/biotin-[acetyl-CoA-carboxylase] ligase